MKIKIIKIILRIILASVILNGCFIEQPIRDNINDPNNTLDFDVELIISKSVDSIQIEWNITGTPPTSNMRYNLSYGTAPEMEDASNNTIKIENGSGPVEGLTYGTMYNFWLRGSYDDNADETIFIKYFSAMPEASGSLDPDFGINSIVYLPLAGGTAYDIKSNSENFIYVSGSHDDGTKHHLTVKLKPDGSLDTSFNGTGYFVNGASSTLDMTSAIQEDIFMSFIKDIDGMELKYYKDDGPAYATFTGFNFEAEAAVGYYYEQGTAEVRQTVVVGEFEGEFAAARGINAVSPDDGMKVVWPVENNGFSFNVDYGRATDICYRYCDGAPKLYICGYIKDFDSSDRHIHAIIVNSASFNYEDILLFNDDWDPSENRIGDIGMPGPVSTPKIAADEDNNVYVAGVGIVSKLKENGDVFDIDSSWGESGSIVLADGACPVEIITQANGKILVFANKWSAMDTASPTFEKAIIYRINTDGAFDPQFGTDGRMEISGVEMSAADLKPDGRLVICDGGGSIMQLQ